MQQPKRFVEYLRVSTRHQGAEGLGVEAQRIAVRGYVEPRGELVGSFVEVESGRKSERERPQLAAAMAECRRRRAALVVAKGDRLSRDVRDFLRLLDEGRVPVVFADMPDVDPRSAEGRAMLTTLAAFSEFEARRGGARTKAALQAAKARGVQLGVAGPRNLAPVLERSVAHADEFAEALRKRVEGCRKRGLPQRAIVDEFNAAGLRTSKGGEWSLIQVQRLLARLDA